MFVTIFLAVVTGVAFWAWLAGLPGRISPSSAFDAATVA